MKNLNSKAKRHNSIIRELDDVLVSIKDIIKNQKLSDISYRIKFLPLIKPISGGSYAKINQGFSKSNLESKSINFDGSLDSNLTQEIIPKNDSCNQ